MIKQGDEVTFLYDNRLIRGKYITADISREVMIVNVNGDLVEVPFKSTVGGQSYET